MRGDGGATPASIVTPAPLVALPRDRDAAGTRIATPGERWHADQRSLGGPPASVTPSVTVTGTPASNHGHASVTASTRRLTVRDPDRHGLGDIPE